MTKKELKQKLAVETKKQFEKLTDDLATLLNNWNEKLKNYPISGSNIFATKEYIKSFNHWDKSQDANATTIPFEFNFLWTELRFFENLLRFEGDEFLELYGHRLSQVAIVNGCVGVYRPALKNDFVVLGISPIYTNTYGEIQTAHTFLAPFFAPSIAKNVGKYGSDLNTKYQNKEIDVSKSPWKNKIAFWKWNSLGQTVLWEWYPFVNLLSQVFGFFQTNIPLAVLNWIFYIRNSDPEKTLSELKNFRDKTSGVKVIDARLVKTDSKGNKISGDMQNGYKIEELKRHPNEFTASDFAIVRNIMNYCTGHYANVNEKKERNTSAETTINTIHFGVSWMEYLREAEIFVRHYNLYFNKNARVRLQYDLLLNEDTLMGKNEGEKPDATDD